MSEIYATNENNVDNSGSITSTVIPFAFAYNEYKPLYK